MFNSKHYTPILKWKRAEQGALKNLTEKCKKNITPLIQLVMPKQRSNDTIENVIARFKEQLKEIPYKIIDVWGYYPIFIDVSLLFTTQLKVESLIRIIQEGNRIGGIFIPVIHLSDDEMIKKMAIYLAREKGLCLRLICPDFSDFKKLEQNIIKFFSSSGLKEKNIDLLIDIKETEKNGDKYFKYLKLSQNIPLITSWRTFIFAAGSFPKDLSECKIDEENLLPRIDWIHWKNNLNNSDLLRKPAFADYTIQNPIYKEASQFFHPTSSIKYTLEDEWLIMKGQKQKFELYLASAAELVKDSRYYGENFSYGDKYISEKALHFPVYIRNPEVKGTGSTETWLIAGISHHLTLVAGQIASLA